MKFIVDYIHRFPYLVFVVSFIVGYLFMPVVVKIAKDYKFVVSPNKRTSHQGMIPNVGGLNIFVSFLLTVFFFSFEVFSSIQFMLMGLLIILIVGFIDDLISIKVMGKLFGQFLSAFFLIVIADVRLTSFHGFLGVYEISEMTSYLISFFVFVVLVNAMNLIDGIDGLASGLGVIYSLFFGIYFHLTNHIDLAITAYALAGSLSVFFIYNVFSDDKKIFMGDSGSLLLGYMIVVFVILFNEMNAYEEMNPVYQMSAAPAVSFSLLAIPLFDTMRVMITRIKKGYSPFKADKNHVHHLLLSLGLKHREVSFLLMSITLTFMVAALFGRNQKNEIIGISVLLICILLTKFLWVQVDKRKNQKKSETTI